MVDMGTKLVHGLGVMVIGMLVVFAGLIILICAVKVMNYLFDRFQKEDAQAVPEVGQVAVAQTAPGLALVNAAPVLEAEAVGELATVAGLTAVIMAAQDTGKEFVVKAIRKVDGSAWRR